MAMTNEQYDSINAYLATNPTADELAAAQAQFGVSNADLAAARDYASGVTIGPGGGGPAQVRSGGTKSQGYSRDYSGQELANIAGSFEQYRNDPAKMMELMSQYGVSVKDIALAVGGSGSAESLQGYNNYFTQAGAPAGFGGMYTSADISKDDKAYIDWMLAQPNGTGGTLADTYKAQKIDPYNNAGVIAQAKAQNERADRRNDLYKQSGNPNPPQYDHSGTSAGIKPWSNPTWQQDMANRQTAIDNRPNSPGVVVGPGGLLTGGTGTTTPVVPPAGTGTSTGGLLTTSPNLPPRQVGDVSTFGSTYIPTGAANQYSRVYPEQDLANIRDYWSKNYQNRGQAIADMAKYGVSIQDLAMATNQPYQQLANYLKEGGAPAGFGGAIEGAGGLFKRAADMAQQPGIQFGTTQGLLSDPTSQLARNILARDTQYQQTAPLMGSGRWGMPSIAPGGGLLAPDYWLAANTAAAQRTAAAANQPPVDPNSYFGNSSGGA